MKRPRKNIYKFCFNFFHSSAKFTPQLNIYLIYFNPAIVLLIFLWMELSSFIKACLLEPHTCDTCSLFSISMLSSLLLNYQPFFKTSGL